MQANALVMAEPGRLERRELEVPEPGPEEALLRVELSGICGTDVHMHEGGMDLPFPVVPGHEFAGVLEAVGEDVGTDAKGDPVSEGDAATVVPGIVCGECWYCNNVPTRPTTCSNRDVYGFRSAEASPYAHGGFSQYLVIEPDASVYRLPDELGVELGALAEPMAVATHAFERAFQPGVPYAREGFGIGKRIAVQGAGPVGLLAMTAARAAGAEQVIAVDVIEDRLELAERFGATDVVDLSAHGDTAGLRRAVHASTPGDVGPDVVIEAAGVPEALRQGIELVRDGGTLVEVGHYADAGTVELNPTRIVQKDLDLLGSLAYPPTQFETAISLLRQRRGDVPFGTLFNCRVGFEEAEEAYRRQAEGEAYRATIHPWGV